MHSKTSNLLHLFDEFYYQQLFPWNTTKVILGLSNFQTWSGCTLEFLAIILVECCFIEPFPWWFNPNRLLQTKRFSNKQFFLESHSTANNELSKWTHLLSNFIIFTWLVDHTLAVGFKMTEFRRQVKPSCHLALSSRILWYSYSNWLLKFNFWLYQGRFVLLAKQHGF